MAEKIWSSTELTNEDVLIARDSMECLGSIIKEHIPEDFIYIQATRFNWTNREGYKIIPNWNQTPLELSQSIIPSYESTLNLFKDDNKLYAVVSSHDVPTGGTWYFHGLIDTEEIMDEIVYNSIHYLDCLEEFKSNIEERLNFDFSNWIEEDVDTEYTLKEGQRVVTLKPKSSNTYLDFEILLNEEGIVEEIDYCSEQLKQYYISDILSL